MRPKDAPKKRPALNVSAGIIRVAATLLCVFLLVGMLSLAQVVLVPVALAVMLTFVLNPLVTRLDREGMNRVAAVLLATGTAALLVAVIFAIVASQVHSLASDLPIYRENIKQKVTDLRRGGSGGVMEKVRDVLEDAADVDPEATPLQGQAGGEDSTKDRPAAPIPVQIVAATGAQETLSSTIGSLLTLSPLLEALATGGFSFVLVIFMLIQREDLRNRLVSFVGQGNLALTTKALDDAGQRISRYLIMQLILNGTFGLAVGLGLLLIGVPYALIWGLCAGVFRYIPYLGPCLAAILPMAVSFITSPEWTQPLLVLALFMVLELFSNNVLEPWFYGQGIGVSAIALLVSAAFWTWIWGAVGLVLATPLTVCLVVIGKYVPALSFLDRLLGDTPPLPPHMVFLQRLLAGDDREATDIVRAYGRDNPTSSVYDHVLIPALGLARAERANGAMTAEEDSAVRKVTQEILLELTRPTIETPAATATSPPAEATSEGIVLDETPVIPPRIDPYAEDIFASTPPQFRVMGCAAHQQAEELTLLMLADLVRPADLVLQVVSTRVLVSQIVERVDRDRPSVVVIGVLPPGGLEQARFLCRTLRKKFPQLGIVVGCWGVTGNLDRTIAKLRSAGAHYVTTTLLGAREHVLSLSQHAASSLPVVSPSTNALQESGTV